MKEYVYLLIPFISLILCQIIKFTIESIQNHKLKWGRLFNGAGGMPSSHTTFSFALTFTIGYRLGFTTPLFAIALVFSLIVCYDAMGVRMESGKQAYAINQILDKIFEDRPAKWMQHLKEELGHKPLEVLVGIVFAFGISLLLNVWIDFLF
ncbi:MAG: divergent PAP2 family protein [Bacilli bacterium]|nr:divergent PAP2 family protein [Bacilli bacterium]